VLVDTDILIKVYRGNNDRKIILDNLKNRIAISIITALELYQGVDNSKKIIETSKQIRAYQVLHLTQEISVLCLQLFKKYSLKRKIRLADCFIATTSLYFRLPLYTDNIKDYNFYEGIMFYDK
jgi:predicted nucleic acid-binding protein